MPVLEGVFVERVPLALAERHVHFTHLDAHIVQRRYQVERAALTTARRLGFVAGEFGGLSSQLLLDQLEERLARALDATARFGFTEAQREVRSLRAERPALAHVLTDAGNYGTLARRGLEGIRRHVRQRSREVAAVVAAAAAAEVAKDSARPKAELAIAGAVAAAKALHLGVLELVGETLNMGRTAGALALAETPTYALRSEQLDRNTCGPCTRLHGEIALVDSGDYYALMPPSDCLGGGRCRGLMIFGDGRSDVRVPLEEAA